MEKIAIAASFCSGAIMTWLVEPRPASGQPVLITRVFIRKKKKKKEAAGVKVVKSRCVRKGYTQYSGNIQGICCSAGRKMKTTAKPECRIQFEGY